jgi:hypothetical protein
MINIDELPELITTSKTPRAYLKECLEKKIRRCSKCKVVKKLNRFSLSLNKNNNRKFFSSHCYSCSADSRQEYVKKQLKTDKNKFLTTKKIDTVKGIHSLRKGYIRDTLATGFRQYLIRINLNTPEYSLIHDCITPDMEEAKKNLILLTRKLKINEA